MIGVELQKALYAALTAAPALADGRVYDRVPEGADFPRITIGDDQVLDDGTSCSDGWEVFSDVHVWSRSRAGSRLEAKALAASVVARTVDASLTVSGFTVVVAQLQAQRSMRDPDGLTEHVVVSLRHVLVPT